MRITIVTKSLIALALTSSVSQAHVLDLTSSWPLEPSIEDLGSKVVWNTASSYADNRHAVDAVFRRALPWEPETLEFSEVYRLSSATAATADSEASPFWPGPVYDAYIAGSNMFAPATYWIACIFLGLLAILLKLQRILLGKNNGQQEKTCVFCDSREIRRVPVGQGMLADIRRALGQRAFRCNVCTSKFFRRWDYEGAPTASRARLS
jgi:hypothetical protein